MAQTIKHLPTIREIQVQTLGWEDLLEKEVATHSSILAWKIPWTEEPGKLHFMGSLRVGHDWATFLSFPLLSSAGKESACNVGDLGLTPGLERSPGEGKGYPLQYSGLENSIHCIVHGVTESDTTERLSVMWFWVLPYAFNFSILQSNNCQDNFIFSFFGEGKVTRYIWLWR